MQNVSFKGYTNILSAFKVPVGHFEISYIAAKLDDTSEPDLTKLRELRKLQGYPDNLPNDDVLTCIHISDGKSEAIYFGDKQMCWGDNLKDVYEHYVPEFMSENEYKRLEKAHLKAYTLLASITKRMSFEKFDKEDENIKKVISALNNNLLRLKAKAYQLFDQKDAFELVSVGCLKTFKFQPIANKFNKKIAMTMAEFFK